MKIIELHPIDRWGWECPKCGDWNEIEENPGHTDADIYCDGCGADFGIDEYRVIE